jgi:hypothetical protein
VVVLNIFGPILLLCAACVGYGALVLIALRRNTEQLPLWLRAVVAYFLGQGLLAVAFTFAAIWGRFATNLILAFLAVGAAICVYATWRIWKNFAFAVGPAIRLWWATVWYWKIIDALTIVLFLYGVTAIGAPVTGDAVAFYLPIAKVAAYTGQLAPLRGYESLSGWGLTAEMLISSLMTLGVPGVAARIYSWVNYAPTLVALYAVARMCALSRREAFLSVVMAVTSSAAIVLWGSGKTDLFAVGPALIATVFALASWKDYSRKAAIVIAGVFCGFASIAKFSYIPVLVPSLLLLVVWQDVLSTGSLLQIRNWSAIRSPSTQIASATLIFLFGFTLGFFPLIAQNIILLHKAFGPNPGSSAWFQTATTLRLLLSYPIALTYGRYWAQFGTLSPLILAFLPLLLLMQRKVFWRESALAALTISTSVGLLCWLLLMPSIFMPRYILATLLLFSVPAAAAAMNVSRRSRILRGVVVVAIAFVILITPLHVSTRQRVFDPVLTLRYLKDPREEILFAGDSYFLAHTAINERAATGDRVLLLTYYRLWLRSDLLVAVSDQNELGKATMDPNPDKFWEYFNRTKFRFILLDANIFPAMERAVTSPPDGVAVCNIADLGRIKAFEVGRACPSKAS